MDSCIAKERPEIRGVKLGIATGRDTSPRPGTVVPRFRYQRDVLLGHPYNVALRLHLGLFISASSGRSPRRKETGASTRDHPLRSRKHALSDKAYHQSINGIYGIMTSCRGRGAHESARCARREKRPSDWAAHGRCGDAEPMVRRAKASRYIATRSRHVIETIRNTFTLPRLSSPQIFS